MPCVLRENFALGVVHGPGPDSLLNELNVLAEGVRWDSFGL